MTKLIRLLAPEIGDREQAELLPLISPKEALILQLLIDRGEMYGLALVDASEGELKRGTIYVTLNRMEEKGYVESWKDPHAGPGPAKRMYKVKGHGARVFAARQMVMLAKAGGAL